VPGVPAAVADAVERALVFEPAERWQSARAMAEALEAVVLPGADGKPLVSFEDHTEPMVTLLHDAKPASAVMASLGTVSMKVSPGTPPRMASLGTVSMKVSPRKAPRMASPGTVPMMVPLPTSRVSVPPASSELRQGARSSTRRFVVGGALVAVVIVAVLWFASSGLFRR